MMKAGLLRSSPPAVLIATLLVGLLTESGCTRQHFREKADKEAFALLNQKSCDPRWSLHGFFVYPDPRARFADMTSPDRPPMPPDDPAAKALSPNPQKPGKAGVALVEGVGYLKMLEEWDALNRTEAAVRLAESASAKDDDKELLIQIPAGPPLGDLVVRAEGVKKGYGDMLLYDDLTFDLPRGGIVGVIGPNGAGKTTLFKMIVGLEQPDGGKLTVGTTVKPAHVDQNRDALNPNNTIFEEITGGTDYIMLGKQRVASRAYVARFNFKGPDQQKIVGSCSGGERNRIQLAKLLRGGGNLLLLDEPTNDLDVDTLRALENALENFGGCAVVISHDRWFLDRLATHILAFEGDGQVVWCEGNFQVYEEQRKARLGDAADRPSKMKYRKLTT